MTTIGPMTTRLTAKQPTRPRLQSRAISEMGPLYNPPSDEGSRDLGQGTRPRKATSRLPPRGGLAPLSPFLPLPPAPTSEELSARNAREKEDGLRTPRPDDHQRPTTSSTVKATKSAKMRTLQASGMMRSYSTPVATQKEYDEQCRAFDARIEAEGSDGLLFSSGWPATTSSFAAHREQRRQAEATAAMVAQGGAAMAASPSQASHASKHGKARRSGMSPLAFNMTALNAGGSQEDMEVLQNDSADDDSYFGLRRFDHGESPSPACSEGPATPKAITPTHLMAFSPISADKAHGSSTSYDFNMQSDDDSDFLIHPDHLAPPAL